jgi:hypothetical protein
VVAVAVDELLQAAEVQEEWLLLHHIQLRQEVLFPVT